MSNRHIDLKRELEELRKRAEGIFKPERRAFDLGAFGAERSDSAGRRDGAAGSGIAVRLPDVVAGEETFFGGGAFWRVLTDAGAVWPDAEAFHREYLEALGNPFFPEARGFASLKSLKTARPERICYLDIETTGLRMSPLFLVGLMYTAVNASGGSLVVDQLFARDYSEEEVVLGFLAECMPRFDILVTFNGISFDVPYIQERMTVHRLVFRRASGSHRSPAACAQRRRREDAEPPASDPRDALLQAEAGRRHRRRRHTRRRITSSCGRTTRRTWRISFTTTGSISSRCCSS